MKQPRRFFWTLLLVQVALLALPGAARADTIRSAEPFPTRGTATEIIVESGAGIPVAGARVTVVHRPGSEVELLDAVGSTDSRGRVRWTPKDAGIACLTGAWEDSSGTHRPQANISIRFDRPPADGIVVAILAGMILYGTAAYMFGKLRS